MSEGMKKPNVLPSMNAAEMLALSEAEFAEIARNANTKPELLREILKKNVAREEKRLQVNRALQKPKETPDENTQQIRTAVLAALRNLTLLDISRDPTTENRLREEADELIRQADRAAEARPSSDHGIGGMKVSARHKYKNAYLIHGARFFDKQLLNGKTREAAYDAVVKRLEFLQSRVNLVEESSGIGAALHIFDTHARDEPLAREMATLQQTIEDGTATREQQVLFRRLVSAAKGAIFRGLSDELLEAHHVREYRVLMPILEQAIRDSGIYETEIGGVSGPTEAYQLGTIGGRVGYRRNPRPRRSTDDFPEERG